MNAMEALFDNVLLTSGLVTPTQLDYVRRLARHRVQLEGTSYANQANSSPEISDRMIADLLVEQTVLTRYQADQLCAGRTKFSLGPYTITDFIGQGGMGQVYKAVHQVMGRECAVKVLPIHKATPETLQSFRREIRMQAQLDCPYLVRAYDAGHDGNVHYLVSEFIPGKDLRRLIKSRGPLPIQQAARIIMQAALGLQHAHDQGMIHRDVKPGNILVTPEGIAKVSDVGLAGFASDLSDDPRAGKIVGTADYLSPEQIRTPLQVQSVSDIYSLGCTLYYAVCGKVPFPGGDTQSKIRRHLSETPWHPRKFQPDLTEEFVDIIADLMEKDPRQRTQTAAEVAGRLEPWAGDAQELTSLRLTRGPWMAPPPPLLEAVVDIPLEEAPDSIGISAAHSTGQSLEGSQNTVRDRPPPVLSRSETSRLESIEPTFNPFIVTKNNHPLLTIAMTCAIVVPLSLVVGAIIGFLIRHWQR